MKIKSLLDLYLHELNESNLDTSENHEEPTMDNLENDFHSVMTPDISGGAFSTSRMDHIQAEGFGILDQDLADGSMDDNMSGEMESPSDHISEDRDILDGESDIQGTIGMHHSPVDNPSSMTPIFEEDEPIFNNDATNSPSSIDQTFTPSLEESKHSSRNFTSAATKIKRATGQLSSIEARKHNDSDYKQMIYHREKFEYYRDKVHAKYGSRVRSRARQ
jgi:hypothetical protein